MPTPDRIEVTSLYGMHSGVCLVQIAMGDQVAQLSVADAINHARRILEAANAAATDGALARFLAERLEQKPAVIAVMLLELRQWRLENEPP